MRLNAYLEVATAADGAPVVRCTECGATLGPARHGYKSLCLEARRPLAALGPHYAAPAGSGARFEIREYYCPSCLVRFDADVALKGDATVDDVELALPGGG